MSTKALANIVPGGSAAGSALGYRLLTLSGVAGPDAGFALATAGLGSAVVLNLIFWIALLVSIPLRGVNPLYVTAAIAGARSSCSLVAAARGRAAARARAAPSGSCAGWPGKLQFDEDRAAAACARSASGWRS